MRIEGKIAHYAFENIDNNRSLVFNTEATVSQDTLTTVATLAANGTRYITQVICSGEENGRWGLYVDSSLVAVKRTTDRQVDFIFATPYKVSAGNSLDVKVTHFGPDATADFSATIMGFEE